MTDFQYFGPEDIRPLLSIEKLIEPMKAAFESFSAGKSDAPVSVLHPTSRADLHVKSATLVGRPFFTVKMAGWSGMLVEKGEPASSGLIVVFSSETCRPLAIIEDNHLISDYRTAAAGGLAAKLLAREDSTSLAVIGAGVQARLQVQAAAMARPIEEVRVWGRSSEKRAAFAGQLREDLPHCEISICDAAEAAVRGADMIVTATTAKTPIIHAEWLSLGQHVTSVGSDDATKCEVSPDALMRADVIAVDSYEMASRYGNVCRAIEERRISAADIVEIGRISSGECAGRSSDDDITIATLVGLGVQDLAAVEQILPLLNVQQAETISP